MDERPLSAFALEVLGLSQRLALLTAELRQARASAQDTLPHVQTLQRVAQAISRCSSGMGVHDLAHLGAGLEACLQGVAEHEHRTESDQLAGALVALLTDIARYCTGRVEQMQAAGRVLAQPSSEAQAHLTALEERLLDIGSQLTPQAQPEAPDPEALTASDLDVLRRFQESSLGEAAEPAAEGEPPAAPPPLPDMSQAEEIPQEMLEIFWMETRDDLSAFQAALAQMETAEDQSALAQEMRRIAHKIKGAASTLNLQVTASLAHCLEDVLDLLRSQQLRYAPAVLDVLLFGLTQLEAILQLPPGTEPAEREGLAALQEQYQTLLESHHLDELADPEATQPESQRLAEAARQHQTLPGESDPSGASLDQQRRPEGRGSEREHFLRVDARRLDQVMNLLAELTTSRAATEQARQQINETVVELHPALQRVTQIISQLADYEAGLQSRHAPQISTVRQVLPAPAPEKRGTRLPAPAPSLPPGRAASPQLERFSVHDDLLRALRESVNDLTTIGSALQEHLTQMNALAHAQESLATTIQRSLTHVRLVPIEQVLPRLQLTARMIAQEQNKLINFQATGATTEIDRDIIEAITGSLVQLVRNCAAHGIESLEERREQGKPEAGTIWLHAYYSGNEISIEVGDDGRGINAERLINAALDTGKLSAEQAERLTYEEALSLILLPDLSTSPEITTIAGRGVGMDLVRSTVDRLKGSLHIHTTPGHGTTFHLLLPISLGILRALLVRADQHIYAVPFSAVERIALDASAHADGHTALFPLEQLLGLAPLPGSAPGAPSPLPLHHPALLIPLGQRQVGVVVDEVIGEREIVIKPLPPHLRRPGIRGATITPTGKLLLLLDLPELAHRALGSSATPPLPQNAAQLERQAIEPAPPGPVILVVDDSLAMRRTLEFQLTRAGYRVTTARDGLEALELLAKSMPSLLLLDIEMPQMDGYEVLARVRSQEGLKHLPVAMLTSRAATIHRQHALDLGANAYLVKPYPLDQLLSTVAALIKQA